VKFAIGLFAALTNCPVLKDPGSAFDPSSGDLSVHKHAGSHVTLSTDNKGDHVCSCTGHEWTQSGSFTRACAGGKCNVQQGHAQIIEDIHKWILLEEKKKKSYGAHLLKTFISCKKEYTESYCCEKLFGETWGVCDGTLQKLRWWNDHTQLLDWRSSSPIGTDQQEVAMPSHW
jgi:hypothetical protein